MKSIHIWRFSGLHFHTFGLNTERSYECEKIRTRKTPNMNTFHAVLRTWYIWQKKYTVIFIYWKRVVKFLIKYFFRILFSMKWLSEELTEIKHINKTLKTERSLSPDGIYLLKVNNRNIRERCEICSKLTMKTPERRLLSLLLTLHIFHNLF